MNYFAHGRRFLDDPYFLVGTALPDMLSVVDRTVRVRSKAAQAFASDADEQFAAVARGIVQHHADDAWFHQTAAFNELNVEFAGVFRGELREDEGFRPAFLGHIVVELLLDSALIEEQPASLDAYYLALSQIDSRIVQDAVNRIAAKPTDRIEIFLPRFLTERFLYDYRDDGKLLFRLNQVMRRVSLPPLPEGLCRVFPELRRRVALRRHDLLNPNLGVTP